MKRFSFRLAGVARVRQLEAEIAREHYAVSMRALRESEERLYEAVTALTEYPAPEGEITAGDFHWYEEQSTRLADGVRTSSLAYDEATRAANDMGDRWREAEQRSRALARLEASAKAAWLIDYERDEARTLDDIAATRAILERR